MSTVAEAKRALARLASDDPILRGQRATTDIELAARFRERDGLTRLRRSLDSEPTARRRVGRRVLKQFEAYRRAARGDAVDHFHSGRDTPLPRGGQPPADD